MENTEEQDRFFEKWRKEKAAMQAAMQAEKLDDDDAEESDSEESSDSSESDDEEMATDYLTRRVTQEAQHL